MSTSATELERLTTARPEPQALQASKGAEPPEVILRPPRGWQLINLRELWHFRDLLYFLMWRDVKVRYKQTVLGAAWALLQPAMMMVVFTIFFANLARVSSGALPYPIFVYSGLLPWIFFATAIASGGNSVVGSERLVTKIYFPRLAIPLAAAGAAVVDFLVALGLLLLLMLVYGVGGGWSVLLLPPIFAVIFLAAIGMGTLLAALNVAYRDVRYVIPFLVQVWMFATPTIYMDVSSVNEAGWLKALLVLNPMTGLVAGFRAAMLGGVIPWSMLAYSAATAAVMFMAGCLYFRRVEDSFADII